MITPTRGDQILMGRFLATVELLGRTGANEFEIQYDDDRNSQTAPILWWAGANWKGHRVFSEHFPYPAQAAEDLLSRVVNGGLCTRCKRTTVVGVLIEGLCCFALQATDVDEPSSYRWVRSCQAASE